MQRSSRIVALVSTLILVACVSESPVPLPVDQPTELPGDPPMEVSVLQATIRSPAIAQVVNDLEGQPFDQFLEESYRQLLLRCPETITRLGLAEELGQRNNQLDDLSTGYVDETQELERALLVLLRAYDREGLAPEQQISYDVYEWILAERVRGHPFEYHDYPLHHFLGSYHDQLIRLLTEIHPLGNKQDAEDYVARLWQVDVQVQQLLEGLRVREEMGVLPPSFVVDQTREALQRDVRIHSGSPGVSGKSLSVYTVFEEKLETIEELSPGERQALLDAALEAIEDAFIPAYLALFDYVDHLSTLATDSAGVWKLPDGDAYYAYLLCKETSIDLTPDQVHDLGLAEVDRIQEEMGQVFAGLGYPEDQSWDQLMDRAIEEGGYHDLRTQAGKDGLVAAHQALIDEVDARLDTVFDIRPQAQVVVVGGPVGGYYVAGTADGSRPGAFHVGTGGSWVPKYTIPSLTYHEAIPGHHFQIALAQELDLPLFRKAVFFNGYGEGWALYAERLAWEMGLYEDDPYGNVGRLHFELLRAARLVADTGIHTKRWTRERADAYLCETLGRPPGSYIHEVDRYVVRPAQATGYKVGMVEILALRQMAEDRLGDQFDLREFHHAVVGHGGMPLTVLERVVGDYVAGKLPASGTVPPSPRTVTVCASGCSFVTIQAAVDDPAVSPGSTIEVVDGVHTEGEITIGKDVMIHGQGIEATVVQAHGEVGQATDRDLGTIGSLAGTLIADGSCGCEVAGDPLLGPLVDNGGATPTHALLPGSPAIDAVECVLDVDQCGQSRPQGAGCDLGAAEVE